MLRFTSKVLHLFLLPKPTEQTGIIKIFNILELPTTKSSLMELGNCMIMVEKSSVSPQLLLKIVIMMEIMMMTVTKSIIKIFNILELTTTKPSLMELGNCVTMIEESSVSPELLLKIVITMETMMMTVTKSMTTCIMISSPEQVLEIIIMMETMMMTATESMMTWIMNDEKYSLKEDLDGTMIRVRRIQFELKKDDKEAATLPYSSSSPICIDTLQEDCFWCDNNIMSIRDKIRMLCY